MQISCNWLKEYVNFDFTPKQLDETLTMLGVEVESYKNLTQVYEGFYIGNVLSKEKHPNADKLSLCKVNIGTRELQIVCGAPNVAQGQNVVVGVLGAVVPAGNFKLERRKIRDYYSEGMICSQSELELGQDNAGIWVLPADVPVGQSLVQYLELNDIILELSLTPNKSDCNSHLGIAREIAAVMRQKIKLSNVNLKESSNKTSEALAVEVLSDSLCPRYVARVIKDVKNGESPSWLKNCLTKIGLKPRNIVVDVTNYILMDLGQPLHAFDYDKVEGNKIIVKNGFEGEFITLDDKARNISKDMLMICDTVKPVAIAGVMGGKNSEISNETTSVVIESATFNASSIRKTAKLLNISTDASYRYERGADIDIAVYAADKAASMIANLADGKVLKDTVEVYPTPRVPKTIEFHYDYARKIIGTDTSNAEMKGIFTYLGFEVANSKSSASKYIQVTVPNRRVDIFEEIDLIEEIARIINYNNIVPNFASVVDFQRDEIPACLKPLPLRNVLREYLSHSGWTEILTPNMIDIASAILTNDALIRIENPLGEEMSIMRPSMLPSILKVISHNIRQGSSNLAIFETGKIFLPQNNIINSFIDGIDEREQLIMAITGNTAPRQWGIAERKFDFFDIKGCVEELLKHIHINKYKFNDINIYKNLFTPNSVEIYINKQPAGLLGELNANILRKYDIESPVFVASIDLTTISEIEIATPLYSPVSQYPAVKRDLAFIVDNTHSVKNIKQTIQEKSSQLLRSVVVFDVYSGKNIDTNKRSLGFELTFSSMERTLTDQEIEADINNIIYSVEKNFDAELRK